MSADSNSDAMTPDDLRNRLFDLLRNKGLVGKLKSQLRNQLVVELKGVGLNQSFNNAGGYDAGGESLPLRAVNTLVADHLKQSGYDYSLSIFLPESGMAQDKLLTVKDMLQLLRVSSQSKLYATLMNVSVTGNRDEGFLWRLVKEIATINSRPTLENGTQTEVSRLPCTSIEEEFRKVDAYYSSLDDGGVSRVAAVEQRILAYQRLVEERSQSELQLSIARFKDNELSRLKIEERENSRKEVEKSRREMDETYRAKYNGLVDRERNFSEQMQRQREVFEKENYAQRQTILEEIEAVRQREVLLRRQEESNNREKYLAEERLKSLEELARKREDNARRAELEIEHRIRNEVDKFKVEEHARYLDRLKNLEFREEKVKDNERRVGDELQEITHIKVELREKRAKVNELEAELIRVKHDLIGAQKQNEILGLKAGEMADYQIMREDNAVLRRELDNAKIRICELMRDTMVERQKQEDLLRELGHVAAKPTPEVGLLRKQIDQLHLSLRTEQSLGDHTKQQLEQRLETEMDRSKKLLSKLQEQSWKQKEVNWETNDLREQLLDHERALYTKPGLSRSASPCDLIEGSSRTPLPRLGDPSLYQNVVDPHLLFDSPLNTPLIPAELGTSLQSDDGSYSSDLIRDTKNRLKRIDHETEKLDRWYQDCQMRVVSINPVLGPEPVHVHSREGSPTNRNISVSRRGEGHESVTPALRSADFVTRSILEDIDSATGTNFRREVSPENAKDSEPLRTNRSVNFPDSKQTAVKHISTDEHPKTGRVSGNERSVSPAEYGDVSDKRTDVAPVRELPLDSREAIKTSAGDNAGFWGQQPQRSAVTRAEDEPKRIAPGAGDSASKILRGDEEKLTAPSSTKDTEADRRKQEAERFEEERKRRMEDRRRQEEDARLRQQQELEELRRSNMKPSGDAKEQPKKEEEKSQEASCRAVEASKEPEIDPELQKYMAIVQKKREEEKKQQQPKPVAKAATAAAAKVHATIVEDESATTTDEVSAPEDRSDVEGVGDDSW